MKRRPSSASKINAYAAFRATETQGHRLVWCALRGGPRTPSRTTDANNDWALVENALVQADQKNLEARAPLLAPLTAPDANQVSMIVMHNSHFRHWNLTGGRQNSTHMNAMLQRLPFFHQVKDSPPAHSVISHYDIASWKSGLLINIFS